MSGLWGWGGWIVVALIPLAFWALITTFVVLVFHQRGRPILGTFDERPSKEASDDSALGWRPPVSSHD
jgi:hypothetical protein